MHLKNKQNSYQKLISPELYRDIPKTVFAAIATSLLILQNGEKSMNNMDYLLKEEWRILHENGIVPQKP